MNNLSSDKFKPAIAYTIKTLIELNFLNVEEIVSNICYTDNISSIPKNKNKLIVIYRSNFFSDECYGNNKSIPHKPIKYFFDIPILFGIPRVERIRDDIIIIYADIVASAYFVLTRYEEIINDSRDEHDRFLGKESVLYEIGFYNRPVVNEYSEIIKNLILELGLNYILKEKNFSVMMTHDIDHLEYYNKKYEPFRTYLNILLNRKEPNELITSTLVKLGIKKDPYNTFSEILEYDKRVNARSIFYIKSGGDQLEDCENYFFKPQLKKIVDIILKNSGTIGLHSSYSSSISPKLILSEKQKLENYFDLKIEHIRFHYLRWNKISHGRYLENCGLKFDSTLYFPDMPGFRLGVCQPISLFDPIELKTFNIIEYPLLVMDNSLYDERYLNLKPQDAIIYVSDIIKQVKKYKGCFNMLWHNTEYTDEKLYIHNGILLML